ncbi:hypothetical protein [Winogradskyella tangerina]|uniref:hypothetical protein n=1 Tax=Winogradskyella tangerina TaxID=2023240 RepID=UPI000DBE802B|nr:hypothetical protein [Winogradskyella tangerina]
MKRFLKYFISSATILIVISLVYLSTSDTIGFNKTVSWVWDLSNVNIWIIVVTYALFLLVMISVVALLILQLRDNLRKRTKES